MEKIYLGDGVYVAYNQYGQFELAVENGVVATDVIYLEHEVMDRLVEYRDNVYKTIETLKNFANG